MDQALVVTGDPTLGDELARLAAAAGVTTLLCPMPGGPGGPGDPAEPGDPRASRVLAAWETAPLVLVGADAAYALLQLEPARRTGVQVVCWSPTADHTFRDALLLGAERVVELPGGSASLTEALTDLDLGGSLAPVGAVVAVVGGSGGAGATTFACALGQVAARSADTLVVDLDPFGPGCDRLLGLEETPGIRWDSLERPSGRLSARSLREAVPRLDGPGVLAFAPLPAGPLDPLAVREALSAARRGHRTVVVDLPRTSDVLAETAARCALLALVVVPTVTGVAAAARWVASAPSADRIGLVVRGRGGTDPGRVAALVGLPLLSEMADQRGLAESIDLGFGPVRTRRGPLARAAGAVLSRVDLVRTGRVSLA